MSAERVDAPHAGENHVKRWLAKPPKKAKELLLVVGEDERVLCRWDIEDVRPDIAQDVLDAVDGHAEALERDAVATLQYLDASAAVLQSRIVRRRWDGDPSPVPMSGSSADQAAQAQSILERMTTKYMRSIEGLQQQVMRLSESAIGMVERLTRAQSEAEGELQVLRRKIARLEAEPVQSVVVDAHGDESDAALDEATAAQLRSLAGPLLMRFLSSQASATPAAAAPATPAAAAPATPAAAAPATPAVREGVSSGV